MNRDLIKVLLELSVKWGDFTLKSGKKSDLYVDVRRAVLDPTGARVIANAVLAKLAGSVEAIGGVELGAVPMIGTILALDPLLRPGFVIRKAAKEHGTKSRIENCPRPGTRVAIIEDVATTAGSLISAIRAAQDDGLDVVQAVVVVDREEGADEAIRAAVTFGDLPPGFLFTALVTRTNLLPP